MVELLNTFALKPGIQKVQSTDPGIIKTLNNESGVNHAPAIAQELSDLHMIAPGISSAIPTYSATLPAAPNKEGEEQFAQYLNNLLIEQVGQQEAKQQHLKIHNHKLIHGQRELLKELERLQAKKRNLKNLL